LDYVTYSQEATHYNKLAFMRLGLFLGGWMALSAWGGDARVAYLSKQLAEAEDLRLRMQLVVALGAISAEEVVTPLCGALRDREPLVRQAAIKSLSRLRYFSRLSCLESALADSHTAVRNEAIRALQLAARRLTGYWFVITDARPSPGKNPVDNVFIAKQILHSKLGGMGAHVTQEKARAFGRAPMDKRYKLQMKASQKGESLKLEMLVMAFPSQSLKASFSVQAQGKSAVASKVLEKMVQKLLEEAVDELKWFGEAEGG
jgi:hypothetical protein